jgi:hypothetical protein
MDDDEMAREWLREISPGYIPRGFARRVTETCEPLAEVRAAYVGREVRPPRRLVWTRRLGKQLIVGLELVTPPRNEAESAAAQATMRKVLRGVGGNRHSAGVAVLTEAGLRAWRQRGIRVFAREPSAGRPPLR